MAALAVLGVRDLTDPASAPTIAYMARSQHDHRTHNDVNELTGRDTDNSGTDNYTLTYDAVGNLTDDAKDYEYEYDPFGRLRKVKKTTDQSLVAEYRYNGLSDVGSELPLAGYP